MSDSAQDREQEMEAQAAQAAQDAADEEAAFSAGFDDDQPAPRAGESAAEAEEEIEDDDPPAGGDGDAREPAPEPESDPWEGVSPALRAQFEAQAARLEELTGSVNHATGRLRNLQGDLNKLSTQRQAASAAAQAGGDAPTREEIREAAQSSEKYEQLKADFPEWGEAMDEQLGLVGRRLREEILGDIPRIDEAAIRQQIADELRGEMDERLAQQTVSLRHPDWQQTTASQEFVQWAHENGPAIEEVTRYHALLEQSADDADRYLNELIRAHPTWWADRGSLAYSPRAQDVITLLDRYKNPDGQNQPPPAARTRAAGTPPAAPNGAATEISAPGRERNRDRLSRAVPPTSGRERREVTPSDEEEFEAGFNSA